MPRPIRKKQGSTFFWHDWLSDRELASCSLAARGLWIEILCVMFFQTPKGVLECGLDTYLEYRYPDTRMANLIRDELIPFLKELLDKGVCSLGKDMPGSLSVDSIVSRKMYRKWLEGENLSAYGQLGAKARWDKVKKAKKQENQEKWAHHGQPWPSDSQTSIANAWPEDSLQVSENNQHAENHEWPNDSQNFIAKPCSSPALSPSIANQPTNPSSLLTDSLQVVHAESAKKPRTGSRHPDNRHITAIGDVLNSILPETSLKPKLIDTTKVNSGEATTTALLMELSGDLTLGQPEWRTKIQALVRDEKMRGSLNAFVQVAKMVPDKGVYLRDKINAMYAKLKECTQ